MGNVRALTHSVHGTVTLGMVSSLSLASASSMTSADSLTDYMGTSSSSDDEVRSPAEGVRPRSRASFLRVLGTVIAGPRSRQTSTATINPGHNTAASSSESVASPLAQPIPRRPLAHAARRIFSRASRAPAKPRHPPVTCAMLSRTRRFLIGKRVRNLPQRVHPAGPRSVMSASCLSSVVTLLRPSFLPLLLGPTEYLTLSIAYNCLRHTPFHHTFACILHATCISPLVSPFDL
jgi:hypothetical protein